MKKTASVIITVLFSLAGLFLFLHLRKSFDAPETKQSLAGTPAIVRPNNVAAADSATKRSSSAEEEEDAPERAYRAEREKERKEDEAREQREYSTPITFYGLVLDHSAQAVPAARVEYDCVGGSFEGDRELIANEQGRFTISGIRGKRLRIRVTHLGYYNDDLGSSYFVYAGNDRGPDFKPDPNNPVIFRLRKKGEPAELIHRQDWVRFNGDEPERSFSLYDHSRRRDQLDYVVLKRVETSERDNRGQPIRRLEMEVKGGGIQQRTDPFAFIAPDTGYQPSMYFMRPEFGGKLDYFVNFNNGNYARFTIMGSAGDYLIDSYFNPDRSPNLEYDRDKEITVVDTGKMGVDLVYPASDKPLPQTPQPAPIERQRKTLHELRRDPPATPAPPRG